METRFWKLCLSLKCPYNKSIKYTIELMDFEEFSDLLIDENKCYLCKTKISKPIWYPQGLTEIPLCEKCADYLENAPPSKVKKVYWLYAFRKKGKYPRPTKRSGKWLIFVKPENVDEVWRKIKKATENGKLGNCSKVATARPSTLAKSRAKVICVYTYDWKDEKDVMRIRGELRKLGITNKIPYKADIDTLKGKYKTTSSGRISKYYA